MLLARQVELQLFSVDGLQVYGLHLTQRARQFLLKLRSSASLRLKRSVEFGVSCFMSAERASIANWRIEPAARPVCHLAVSMCWLGSESSLVKLDREIG